MNNINYLNPKESGWRRITSVLSMFAISALLAFAMTGCHSSDDDDDDDDIVILPDPPGAPTNFTAVRTSDAVLSATLTWSVPASGGDPSSYEIYRTTTDPAVAEIVDDANLVNSIPAVAGKTNYEYVDNAGVARGDNWWVVSAKNAGGETPSTVEGPLFLPGPPGGVGEEGFGNNFAAAMIFADDIGIGGASIAGSSWTDDLTLIDTNTGLRPSAGEVTDLLAASVSNLPYLDPTTTYTVDGIDYYKQQSVSTWQGKWENAGGVDQNVTGKWGDNLISQRLTTASVIRIEMVLSKDLAPATMDPSYWMLSLYGTRENEIYGTDGTTYENPTAFVFAANAHLKIQKLDGNGLPDGNPLYDQTLWEGDGPGFLAGEVNVAGNFTYGFVWNLKNEVLPADITTGKAGTWRITFSLDGMSPVGTSNNTFIDSVANGVRVSDTEVYIDIQVQ